ncbi:hypothetical protein LMH87_007072 [Akanthomyces muscarius]|uniref:Secreted protein n=1 Tax=Akanthomyces muscarius TaxID=2231603 RepID=A0A9W8QS26_AKAMU|nr:hypothetical protein LMH87_007072 [Akanthomyces muscarius]KAJ4165439.1 hypothetical protein LMH87_007072 [Akanthomyces muscarius]
MLQWLAIRCLVFRLIHLYLALQPFCIQIGRVQRLPSRDHTDERQRQKCPVAFVAPPSSALFAKHVASSCAIINARVVQHLKLKQSYVAAKF